MLTLAIQKKGRLNEQSLQLLRESGIHIANGMKHRLKSRSSNFPVEILYLRDDDIAECLANGAADIGIVGENEFLESGFDLRRIQKLGFGKCRLSIAFPKNKPFGSLKNLNGLSIATSYPNILENFLQENGLSASIHRISGSVEITPEIGLADAIFDIISSGSTLVSNGLKEVYTVLHSEAVLLAAKTLPAEKEEILNQLIFRLRSVLKAAVYKYILLNVPNEKIEIICKILPGMKSPTVIPLAEPGWSSLHSVIREDDFWQRIDRLKENGAQGILVLPIEKMII
ncbi:MAG TPA: ATP phosphoribosyltransferase [Caldithrix abyssi]|uniref:ATP phosphoribosyltransferase n=1 Tax=Caldithrix abyssi TaxID=187145 RepID=A0A7V4U530_CALAY|nr:ATP phosphoribosyltransferase [Caldithrix abyssi]